MEYVPSFIVSFVHLPCLRSIQWHWRYQSVLYGLEIQIFFSLLKAPLAFDNLFFKSFVPPPSLQTLAPKYTNSSTSSISCPLIMIFSWFLELILITYHFCLFFVDFESNPSGLLVQPCRFIPNLLLGRDSSLFMGITVFWVDGLLKFWKSKWPSSEKSYTLLYGNIRLNFRRSCLVYPPQEERLDAWAANHVYDVNS